MVENIIEHIRKAQLEAHKRNIKANTIIIDTELAMINNLLCPNYPNMIMGLEVKYEHNLTENYGINFAITEGNTTEDEVRWLRKENKMLKEKIAKLKEILGVEDDE